MLSGYWFSNLNGIPYVGLSDTKDSCLDFRVGKNGELERKGSKLSKSFGVMAEALRSVQRQLMMNDLFSPA